jgi:hypothetical protein
MPKIGRGFFGASRRMHHVVGADDEGDVGAGEFIFDVLELENHVIGNVRLGQQDVHLTGHAPCHRMNCELDRDTRGLKQLHEFVELLLTLRNGKTIARHDDDRGGITHEDAGIASLDRLKATLDVARLRLGNGTEIRTGYC